MILDILIAAISALYATAGQAGGTGFIAVMALDAYPAREIRITALTLNVVAAGYATARLIFARGVDWPLLGMLLAASAPAAFLGGWLAFSERPTAILTGMLLLAACIALLARRHSGVERSIPKPIALLIGGATGFASGLSGIGGGVFLAPLLVMIADLPPTRVAGLSPPFIFVNSVFGLAALQISGQHLSFSALPLMAAALAGSFIGAAIGLRWRSETTVRYILAAILAVAGAELLVRAFSRHV